MADAPESEDGLAFLKERLKETADLIEQVVLVVGQFDWLGAATTHPEGSEHRRLAELRDTVDSALDRFWLHSEPFQRVRAETTQSSDLLLGAAFAGLGDADQALRLMKRYLALARDRDGEDGEIFPETFPDMFAWDTYLRVSALTELVEKYPRHLQHSARQMHGWPMIVSHHLDCQPEFKRIAEILHLGEDYPLAVGPRRKRGTETEVALLHYLEPLIWRLHVTWLFIIRTEETRGKEEFGQRIYGTWWDFGDAAPGVEELAILRLLPSLPPLSRQSAKEWSRLVIVPVIMLCDAGTSETCTIPALRNIWQHRAVKSPATFQSRLHSAVTDVLVRYGRSD